MTRHDGFLELAAAGIDRPLSAGDRERLAAHLETCPACNRTAIALRADAQAFIELPMAVLPEHRAAAILAAVRTPTSGVSPMRIFALAVTIGLLLIGSLAVGSALMQRDEQLTLVPPPSLEAPSVAPQATASIGPSPSPIAVTWAQIGSFPMDAVYVRDAVGFGGGYAAVMSGWSTVWVSSDGSAWTNTALPFTAKKNAYGEKMGMSVSGIASDGRRLVVVGGYLREPCTKPGAPETGGEENCILAPISWTSTDGITWQRGYPGPMPTAPEAYPHGGQLETVWPVPSGGWDASLAYSTGAAGAYRGALMHSDDGLTWTPLAALPELSSSHAVGPWPITGVAAGDGTRIVWQVGDEYEDGNPVGFLTALVTSPDGSSWETVAGFPTQGAQVFAGLAPSASDGRWMLVGAGGLLEGSQIGHAAVWSGAPNGQWTETRLPEPQEADGSSAGGVIRTADGLLAQGTYWFAEGITGEVTTYRLNWTSADGLTWTVTTPDADPTLNDAGTLAQGPAGIITLVGYLTDTDAVTRVLAFR
jgi:hypothetical protein